MTVAVLRGRRRIFSALGPQESREEELTRRAAVGPKISRAWKVAEGIEVRRSFSGLSVRASDTPSRARTSVSSPLSGAR